MGAKPRHAQGHGADNRPDLLPGPGARHAMPYDSALLAALLYWCAALGAAVAVWLCASPPYGSLRAYRGFTAAVVAGLVVVLCLRHPPRTVDQEYPDDVPKQIQQKPPRLALTPTPTLTLTGSILDASQVAAAIRSSMSDSTRPTLAVSPPQADSSDSDGGGSSTTGDETNHFWYTSVQLLDAGDARLIVPNFIHQLQEMARGLPEADAVELLRRAFRDANKPDGFYRLSEVVEENQWIIFADPDGLTDRSIMTMKITAKLICLVWSELDEQNWKSCQEVKEECFREVVSQSVEELLDVALSFSNAGWSADHPLPRLTIIDVLVDVLYNIRELPVSRTEFIHDVVAHVFCKMVIDLTGMLEGSTNDMRRSRENTIHPATVLLVRYLDFFRRNGGMMQSVLGTEDCSIELTMIGSWVSKLSKDAQVMFPADGQSCIYVLNNIDYVYQLKHHPGGFVASIELQADLRRLRRQYINSYLDECWEPLVRHLGGDSLKTRRRLSSDKFLEAFFTIHDSQITWKVRTRLKERLRKEIVELVVPEYANFLQVLQENPRWRCSCWLRGMRSEKPTRTAAWLELVIRGIFER